MTWVFKIYKATFWNNCHRPDGSSIWRCSKFCRKPTNCVQKFFFWLNVPNIRVDILQATCHLARTSFLRCNEGLRFECFYRWCTLLTQHENIFRLHVSRLSKTVALYFKCYCHPHKSRSAKKNNSVLSTMISFCFCSFFRRTIVQNKTQQIFQLVILQQPFCYALRFLLLNTDRPLCLV